MVGLSEGLLGLSLFRDVGVGAEPASDVCPWSSDRDGSGEEPSVVSVSAQDWEGVFPGLSTPQVILELGHDAVEMVRVMNRLPAPALHLFEGGAGVVEPSLVVPGNSQLVGHPGKLSDVVGQCSGSTTFPLLQRDGVATGLGDVSVGFEDDGFATEDLDELVSGRDRRLQAVPCGVNELPLPSSRDLE